MKWCVINNDGTLYYGDDAKAVRASRLRRAYFGDFLWFNVADTPIGREVSNTYGGKTDAKSQKYLSFYDGYGDPYGLRLMCGTYPFMKKSANRPWLINKFLTYLYDSLTIASQIVVLYSMDDECGMPEFKKSVGDFVDGLRKCYADCNGLVIGKERETPMDDTPVSEIRVYASASDVVRISGDDNIGSFVDNYMTENVESPNPVVSGDGTVDGNPVKVVKGYGALYVFEGEDMSIYFGTDTSWIS